MIFVSGTLPYTSGLLLPCPSQRPIISSSLGGVRLNGCSSIRLCPAYTRVPAGRRILSTKRSSNKHIASVGRDSYDSSYDDDLAQEEPFWLILCREAIWALKTLFAFVAEQPSQLKYIEWPSFQSTLKTAMLTLIIVALLIVALSSVDSVMCYLLVLFLKRTS